jgi:hypothetical protein
MNREEYLQKTFPTKNGKTYIQSLDEFNLKKNMEEFKFKVGDKVYKPKGYKFPGTVVSVFKTTTNEIRIVAELEDNGMLHIFSESQLELITN